MTFDPKKLAEGIPEEMQAEERLRMARDRVQTTPGGISVELSAIATMATELTTCGVGEALKHTQAMLRATDLPDKITDIDFVAALICGGAGLALILSKVISKGTGEPPILVELKIMQRAMAIASHTVNDIAAAIQSAMDDDPVKSTTLRSGVHMSVLLKSDLDKFRQPPPSE